MRVLVVIVALCLVFANADSPLTSIKTEGCNKLKGDARAVCNVQALPFDSKEFTKAAGGSAVAKGLAVARANFLEDSKLQKVLPTLKKPGCAARFARALVSAQLGMSKDWCDLYNNWAKAHSQSKAGCESLWKNAETYMSLYDSPKCKAKRVQSKQQPKQLKKKPVKPQQKKKQGPLRPNNPQKTKQQKKKLLTSREKQARKKHKKQQKKRTPQKKRKQQKKKKQKKRTSRF